MTSKIKLILVLILTVSAYFFGFSNARTEGELAIEQLKLVHTREIIEAQNEVKVQYNEKIQTLNDDLSSVRKLNANRLRQLEKFSTTSRDLETCSSERRELAELAVRGEELLFKADAYIRAMKD